ncbi:hypothetical protein ACRAWC_12255 [Leifsonia sp. L25]|uniref:hypothetical protein n=1 Tax=Actinomycetes TaxID=1760 RepID=UPI003D6905A9
MLRETVFPNTRVAPEKSSKKSTPPEMKEPAIVVSIVAVPWASATIAAPNATLAGESRCARRRCTGPPP